MTTKSHCGELCRKPLGERPGKLDRDCWLAGVVHTQVPVAAICWRVDLPGISISIEWSLRLGHPHNKGKPYHSKASKPWLDLALRHLGLKRTEL